MFMTKEQIAKYKKWAANKPPVLIDGTRILFMKSMRRQHLAVIETKNGKKNK